MEDRFGFKEQLLANQMDFFLATNFVVIARLNLGKFCMGISIRNVKTYFFFLVKMQTKILYFFNNITKYVYKT